MIFLPRREQLLTSHADRFVRFWSTRTVGDSPHFLCRAFPSLPEKGSDAFLALVRNGGREDVEEEEEEDIPPVITSLFSDAQNDYLYAGDSWGVARVLDLRMLDSEIDHKEKRRRDHQTG